MNMKGKWRLKGIQLQESSRVVLSTTWTGREGRTGTLQSCLSVLVSPELSLWLPSDVCVTIPLPQHLCREEKQQQPV